LPEGEIRALIAKQFRISEKNAFDLLEKIGGDCAGAVSILPMGGKPVDRSGYKELDEAGLHKVLSELPKRPLLAGEKGIRLSLAGAQSKLPVYIDNGKIHIATGNSPSTHILKPPISHIEQSVENEAFCMALARLMQLPVAYADILKNKDTILVVERYDRERQENGTIVRLHQEDFCQALGILPEQKYESEGGPSLVQCFDLLKKYSIRPAADQMAMLQWVIFNYLIGNADDHAKNISLLFTDKGPRLAPFYDLISTHVYETLAERFAMKIGGENRPNYINSRHWERFAESVSLKRNYVLNMVRNMAERIIPAAESIRNDLDKDHEITIINNILELLRTRAAKLTSTKQ
jgi:serine/threonine-protein kinase HipA